MSRYIDADELKDFIERYGGDATVEDCIKWIELTDTADVLENVRGEWVHKEIKSDNFIDGVIRLPNCYCSVCGVEVLQECNFCPNCGAQMER